MGGSEEAVVYLTHELANMGYHVEVYGDPPEEDMTMGGPRGGGAQGGSRDEGREGCGKVGWYHHSQVGSTGMVQHHTI